jgi:hypothetical protein
MTEPSGEALFLAKEFLTSEERKQEYDYGRQQRGLALAIDEWMKVATEREKAKAGQ